MGTQESRSAPLPRAHCGRVGVLEGTLPPLLREAAGRVHPFYSCVRYIHHIYIISFGGLRGYKCPSHGVWRRPGKCPDCHCPADPEGQSWLVSGVPK